MITKNTAAAADDENRDQLGILLGDGGSYVRSQHEFRPPGSPPYGSQRPRLPGEYDDDAQAA